MIKSDEAVIESARRYPRRTANHPECTRHGAAGHLAIVHVKSVAAADLQKASGAQRQEVRDRAVDDPQSMHGKIELANDFWVQ
jgi:hypothetical protein